MDKKERGSIRAGLNLLKLADYGSLDDFLQAWKTCRDQAEAVSRLKMLPHLLKGTTGDILRAMLFCLEIAAPPIEPRTYAVQRQAFRIAGEKLVGNEKSVEFLLKDIAESGEGTIKQLMDFLDEVLPIWFPEPTVHMQVSEKEFQQANARFAELLRCLYAVSISMGRPRFLEKYDSNILYSAWRYLKNYRGELRVSVIKRELFEYFFIYQDDEASRILASHLLELPFVQDTSSPMTPDGLMKSWELRRNLYREFRFGYTGVMNPRAREHTRKTIAALERICFEEAGWY